MQAGSIKISLPPHRRGVGHCEILLSSCCRCVVMPMRISRRYIAQRHHGRAGQVSCRRGLKICRLSEEVAGWLSCRHDRASLFLLLALIKNYLLEYCGRRQASSRLVICWDDEGRAGPSCAELLVREAQCGYVLVHHLLYSRSGQYANSSPIEHRERQSGSSCSGSTGVEEKKSPTRRRVGTAHGSTALQLLSGASEKAPSLTV